MTALLPGKRSRERDANWITSDIPLPASALARHSTPRSFPLNVAESSEQLVEPALKRRKLKNKERALGATDLNPEPAANSNDHNVTHSPKYETNKSTENLPGCQRRRLALFPPRPNRPSNIDVAFRKPDSAHSRLSTRDVSTKPYVSEAPSSAPQLRCTGAANFFPWTRDQAENVLNDSTIRNGFCDRPQVSLSDSSTARHPLWHSLKHRSGLQSLSSTFISALEQRQAHGQVATPSTFKPPPRVTLTDSKRESWLKDLSDPSVSLRRLSRTIPHGIRGKVLLGHCLSKDIPISRAIWLTKCVGANEIRASKRKGPAGVSAVGGELKWVKDWTMNVEQFLDSIATECGNSEWAARIDYSVRFVSQIYSENLLDREHYLDWLLMSIAESDLHTLAIWLLYLTVHLQDLVENRKRGKRLVELLLSHLERVHHIPGKESYRAITLDLVEMLQTILSSAPACFLIPTRWEEYEHLIERYLIQDKHALRTAFEDVLQRNLKLQGPPSTNHSHAQLSSDQKLIALFDSLAHTSNISAVAHRSLDLTDDHGVILGTCLQWSTSKYRRGLYRIYAGARLMRLWSRHGVDVQGHILSFLEAKPDLRELHRPDFYKLLAELVCSKHFSVGRYLQWLMARGGLDNCETLGQDDRCDVQLLLELPLHGQSRHILNLRHSLVSRFQVSVDKEEQMSREMILTISKCLSLSDPQPEPASSTISSLGIAYRSQMAKSAAARWLRHTFASLGGESETKYPWPGSQGNVGLTASHHGGLISPGQFRAILRVFEELGEFPMLADLLSFIISRVHRTTLTVISDTINYHRQIFIALGAARHLFLCLYNRVQANYAHEPPDAPLLASLDDLSGHLPEVKDEVRHLRKWSLSANRTMVACSPISDTVIETVQRMDVTFVDELDQMLANGTSMDKQTMARLFRAATDHLKKTWTDNNSLIKLAGLLSRLRAFGPKVFEALVVNWVNDLLSSNEITSVARGFRPMICSRIITLELVIDAAINILEKKTSDSSRAQLALDVLHLMTNADVGPSTESQYHTYRLHDQQELILRTSPLSFIKIFRIAADIKTAASESGPDSGQTRLESPPLLPMLYTALLQAVTKSAGVLPLDEESQKSIGKWFLKSSEAGDDVSDATRTFARLLNNVNQFNMLSYQLTLQAVVRMGTPNAEGHVSEFARMLIESASKESPNCVCVLTRLVSVLTQENAKVIREQAEGALISDMSELTTTWDLEICERRQNLLALVEAIASSSSTQEPSYAINSISSHLSSLLSPFQRPDNIRPRLLALQHLHKILRLLVIHQSDFQQLPKAQDTLPRILLSLGLVFMGPALRCPSGIDREALDALSLLSDYLPQESRTRCARRLYVRSKAAYRRLTFLFGHSESLRSEWLQLVSRSFLYRGPGETSPKDRAKQPYPLRKWEMMPDATPLVTWNDTSLSLRLFGAKKSAL